jgi:hypothetical protein
MKSQHDIEQLRKKLLGLLVEFGERHEQLFAGKHIRADQLFYFGLGALSFADNVLESRRPNNFVNAMESMERDNAAASETEAIES